MFIQLDSNELACRMHGEAAKAVKYGGIEPHEALVHHVEPCQTIGD